MQTDLVSFSGVQLSAMGLLAMREHSALELKQKLLRKFDDQSLVDQVIEDLIVRNLQSDERFTEAFIKMRMRQGKGPTRISYDLAEKGIAPEYISRMLTDSEFSWLGLAQEVRSRRFGSALPRNSQDKAKQMRFLYYRGFTSLQIQQVFREESD